MRIQLSSGLGPVECRVAVGGIYRALVKEFPDIKFLSGVQGEIPGSYSSVIFSTESDLSKLEGTIQWINKSEQRPGHKRKNWFINCSILEDETSLDTTIKKSDIKTELFHCGGNGGQNVNKVETGVRLIHIPTGIIVECTEERTQLLNRNKAIKKLESEIKKINNSNHSKNINDSWKKHTELERGNPVRIYEGNEFKLRREK